MPKPKITLKLIQERRSGSYRKVDGNSGKNYLFRWSSLHRAYICEVNQDEIDDLYAMPRTSFLAPVIPEDMTGEAKAEPPASELEQRRVLRAVLGQAGIEVAEDYPSHALEAIMRAYDKGRSDAAAEAAVTITTSDSGERFAQELAQEPANEAPPPSPSPAAEAPAAAKAAPAKEAPAKKLTKAERKRQERIAAGLESPPAE